MIAFPSWATVRQVTVDRRWNKAPAVLLGVWQEACRHIEISESTANIAAMLVRHVPVEQVLVRRIDRVRSGLETVAIGLSRRRPADARVDCSAAELESLLAWCRRGRVTRRRGIEDAASAPDDFARAAGLSKLVPDGHRGDALIGPLGDPAGHCGVLIFLAPSDCRFEPRHVELVQLLLEPFSVALENDLRLREMTALREAAEADKRSLLTKLGRKAIGDQIVGMDAGPARP